MKRTLWLILLLPAMITATWAWVTARPNDGTFYVKLLLDYPPEALEAEPLLQALDKAEELAKVHYWDMSATRPSEWRRLEPTDLKQFIATLEAEGIACSPDFLLQLHRDPGSYKHILITVNSLEGHHDFGTWLAKHAPPVHVEYVTSLQFMRKWETIQSGIYYTLLESRDWTLDEAKPRSSMTTYMGLNGVSYKRRVLLKLPGFTLTNQSLSYKGPFWIFVFLLFAAPTPFVYMLRRPLLRLLPERARERLFSSSRTT